jgi:phosphopantetheinyl transferase
VLYDTVKLDRSASKKPFLANHPQEVLPNFNFNVSHSGTFVVLAASADHTVGCDVSDVRSVTHHR